MTKIAVVAFGGNALLRGDQKGYYEEQVDNVKKTCENLLPLIKKGYNLVIGHGNGPQVGNVMLQHEAGEKNYDVIKQPMHFCVAETQGSIAYLIEQQLRNVLAENGIKRNVICIVTQVVVDKNDQAFANPAKPVGPFYTEEEAQKLKEEKNWFFNADPRGRGMRRVVASPVPIDVCNWEIVEELAREGNIVVTVGGGGIPVIKEGEQLIGVDAVIDKDLASSFIANKIKADEFYILTDVPKVFINFNTPEQKQLDRITVEEANVYMGEGHFAEGSMAPKVRAAVRFVEGGGAETTITEARELAKENSGTTIYSN